MASREGGIKLNYFDSRSFSSFYQYYRGFMPGTGIHRLKKKTSAFLKVYLGDRHTDRTQCNDYYSHRMYTCAMGGMTRKCKIGLGSWIRLGRGGNTELSLKY